MKIPKANPGVQQKSTHSDVAGSKGKPDKSDPFSKILDEKRKESMPRLGFVSEGQVFDPSPATRQPERISQLPAPIDVERLASETVEHISYHQADGARSIEIQFNSQTLEGLQVNVSSQQGSIAVTFSTSAPWIAGLVRKNLSDLRSALETRGLRVAHLAVRR